MGRPAAPATYPQDAARSRHLHARARQCRRGGSTRTTVYMKPFPIYAARGEGCRVWDVGGVCRIDCINNFNALIHGHAHRVIVQAAQAQLALGTAFGLPTESEIVLAELLCDRVRSVEQIRFCNSGTEAVMMAIKAARAYTGRPKIAKVEGADHGSTTPRSASTLRRATGAAIGHRLCHMRAARRSPCSAMSWSSRSTTQPAHRR